MENDTIRIFLERQKEQILVDSRAEIQKHEFQAVSDRRRIQELNGIIEFQRKEVDHTLACDEQLRRDQLLHELTQNKNEYFVMLAWSLNEMEELKRFQGSTSDTTSRRKLVEDRDTILELTARIQELQNEVNCLNDSRDFLGCWISTLWTIPRSQSTSVTPTFSRSWRNAKPFFVNTDPQG